MVTPDPAFWRGKRVLVTGHTGFVGSWLTLWLLELGAEVWGYALDAETAPSLFNQVQPQIQRSGRFHHRSGDLADLSRLKACVDEASPEIVLHLAAQALVRRSYADPLRTWTTNVIGSMHLLEALKGLRQRSAVVMVTTDKVYENLGTSDRYSESDRLGGHDPYSASKAATEIAIASWRLSFCGTHPHQTPYLQIASARAGNIIGGGDWAPDRIIPDAIRALASKRPVVVRHAQATRPWQHVLDAVSGYLRLAECLYAADCACTSAFNFGPMPDCNRTVADLMEAVLRGWPGSWEDRPEDQGPHESVRLQLEISKARELLGWSPRWSFDKAVDQTVNWYRRVEEGASPLELCLSDLTRYCEG